jgi:YHS domain-containing protein
MKKFLVALMATAIVGAAFADKDPKEIACAVMPMEGKVNVAKAIKKKLFSDYKGRRYIFCCAGCKPTFEKDPAKYAKAPSVKAPKAKTK